MNCYFRIYLNNPELVLCMLYSKYSIDGRHWANYPECCKDSCPLLHPELLGDMIWEDE